jgi:dolichyl-diphosphooligosaccharide--protein glycosyltransferase
MLLIKPVKDSYATSQNRGPEISDAWVQSLQAINSSSQKDAIINSWWDWGHWFKYWGDRGVTFDGASQNSPMAYFIGKVLATEDEHEAIGILRMLDCGSYKAFAYTQKEFGDDTVLTDKWLSNLVLMNRTDAEKAIADKGVSRQPAGMSDDKVLQNINRSTDLLDLTHCDPPEDYFVTSQDMVGKAGVWGHFGLWDFTRAYISVHKNDGDILDVLTKKYGLSAEEAGGLVAEAQGLVGVDEINAWISPWPGYVTGANCNTENNITSCPLNVDIGGGTLTNFVINGTTTTLYASVTNNVGATATAVVNVNAVYIDGVKQESNSSSVVLPYNVIYSQGKLVMLSAQLSNSIFTKLFFFNGEGTEHFEKFHEATTIAGEKIIIWKVKW